MVNESLYRWERPMRGAARLLVWLLLAGLLAAAIWAAFAPVRMYARVTGLLTPRTPPVQVTVPSAGRVVETRVRLWQKVKKGEVLFVLDGLARDQQDAQLQVQIQQTNGAQAQAAIAVAQAEFEARKRDEEGARRIYAAGGLSQAELDAAVLATRAARAKLLQARAQGKAADTQLEVLGRNQRIEVKAPIDGQVMQLADIYTGQTLGAGQASVQILPAGVPLIFKGSAAEADRPKLREGARVQIAWNGYPRQKYGVTVGKLSGVSPTSSAATAEATPSSGGPRYDIEVTLSQQSPALKGRPLVPGMAGEAQVQSDNKRVLGLFFDWIRGADPWN